VKRLIKSFNLQLSPSAVRYEYRLRLADGRSWLLCSTEDTEEWMDRFAGIMKLQRIRQLTDYESSLLLFAKKRQHIDEIHPTLNGAFNKLDWTSYRHYGMTVWLNSRSDDVVYLIDKEDSFEENIYNMWASVYPIYRLALRYGGTPLHAALIERNGMGILFAAPGGTGKTTAYQRLPDDWGKFGDDEILLVPHNQGYFHAHPFPSWSNFLRKETKRTWQLEKHIQVGAIFFLQQSSNDEVIPIKSGHAAALINQSARQIMRRGWSLSGSVVESALKRELIDISANIAKTVPAFMLHLSLTGHFWEKVDEVLENSLDPANGRRGRLPHPFDLAKNQTATEL